MLRNLAAALALILLSQATFALGLGTLKQSSGLNEPFNGRIDILGASASDVDTILVKLADSAQFERAGISRGAVLLQLKFKIVDGSSGADYIQISSREPIREPFLNFLLELNWANGRMIREYTVLLDPPLYDPVRRQAAPSASAPQPVAPPPTQTAEPMVEASPMPETLVEPTSAQPAPLPIYVADSTLDAVVLNDTLWSIASANLPNESVSVQQMMLAFLRANPDAFGSNNINILKRGAILRLPDDAEINAMSTAQAVAEVKRQHQLWSNYRDVATQDIADVELDSQIDADDDALLPFDAETMADVQPEAGLEELPTLEEPDVRLELVAPQAEDDQMGAGGSADGAADVTLAREELDAQVQENTELQARILEANEIIDLMSRQVDIKDDELAALQARLIELGIEAPITEGEAIVAGEEELPADEVITDGEVVDETEAAIEDDEMAFESTDMQDVDITLGDDQAIADVEEFGADDVEEEFVATVDEEMMVEEGGDTAQEQSGSLLGGLIPAHIASMVPGGAMTIFGLLGAGLLGIVALLFKLVRRDSDDHEPVTAAGDEDATALTEGPDDEPITETPELGDTDFSSEDATEIAPEMLATATDYESTLEASVEELAGDEPEVDDPLEEVNVYLAYERFDQAEELVRNVIAEHPDQHSYKLRLLEVFYSSNNKSDYEVAAQDLHNSVQEDDPLWDSAVAMWAEMSPERDLFAEGAVEEKAEDGVADEANAFVDITAEDEAGASTMSMAPGSNAVLESTQVGLGATVDLDDDTGSLDFDLGAGSPDGVDDIVDITATAGVPTDEGEILDLTVGMEESDDILESAIEADGSLTGEADIFDIAPTGELSVDNDLLDVTAPGTDEALDLLDVTKTGASGFGQTEDILNVTSPNLSDDETATDKSSIDIDISETTPLSDLQEAAAEDGVFDITSPPEGEGDESNLDFDIGELEVDELNSDDSDETLDISGGLPFEDAAAGGGLEIDIPEELDIDSPDDIDTVEIVAVVPASVDPEKPTVDGESTDAGDFDLSLQSPELDDLTLGGNTLGDALQGNDAASEIEFDLALEDTTEIDRLVIDDTLELPQSSTPDESLEDLTKSMEDSMAGLDLSDDEEDEIGGELDLSLIDTNSGLDIDFSEIAGDDTETSLDFDLEGIDIEGMDQADTLAPDTTQRDTTAAAEQTDDNVEQLSDSDEVDTKLNLAKAYIELGDKDGARSIIDEVTRDGTPDQKAEAQRLIDQLN